MANVEVLLKAELPLPLFYRGKVRDTYELGENLLMVATDRLSAFDVVFNEGIPYKGIVLTQLSLFWFDFLKEGDQIVSTKVPKELEGYRFLERRTVVVRRAKPMPIECVVRGYLAGSAWKEYQDKGSVCGIELPKGLRLSERLPEPIFTPATKAKTGHDINITEKEAIELVGKDVFDELKERSISIYEKASKKAEKRGIIISDTKFEFGEHDGRIILIDEVLTPDSSRFWPASEYEPGRPQKSFDKQYVRDYLESLGWNKQPPPPTLPAEIVNNTSERYIEAYERITGKRFAR
ncbi:MAG: phosphoribosylaminoimidazolesuccinocarboxamide synthase [Candidatus Micrarchaeia archaeon]